jgi:hypothetical protein
MRELASRIDGRRNRGARFSLRAGREAEPQMNACDKAERTGRNRVLFSV